ncbi:hypothetical protein ACFLT2_02690 [Acidobacteriota bacterium]
MPCCNTLPSLFPEISQVEKDIFSEDIKIWNRHFADQDNLIHPVTFFFQHGLDSKVSLVLLPLLASVGLLVPKILWPSQPEGTSLESILRTISGMKLTLSPDEMRSALESAGGFFACAPESLRIFHDRLISTGKSEWQLFSLLCLLTLNGLDAKSASFGIKINDATPGSDIKNAREFVNVLKELTECLGVSASFYLSYKRQLLGLALGPVQELIEALEILKGRGPHDVKKLALEHGADLLILANKAANRTEAKTVLKSLLLKGDALKKMEEIIEIQGGNIKIVNDYSELPEADQRIDIHSTKIGFVTRLKTSHLKKLKQKLMCIHPGAGLIFQKTVGDPVKEGDLLVKMHFPTPRCSSGLQNEIRNAFVVTDCAPSFFPLIAEKIKGNF